MEKLRFLLVNPTCPYRRKEEVRKRNKDRIFRFSMLTSLYVAAALPDDVEVSIVDEDLQSVDFDDDPDMVGISFMTYNAPRAYEIASRFRNRGIPVIAGGFHPSAMPDEALEHVDAVCIGEAETTIPDVIRDFRKGTLKRVYHGSLADLSTINRPRRELIERSKYGVADFVQATRGCPHRCSFCSVAAFSRYRFRYRPVDDVVDEVAGLSRLVLFLDDNLIGNRQYALELFRALTPLKKYWYSQCSIQIAFDEKLLEAAVRSGCRGLFVGFESLSQRNLDAADKIGNRASDYKRAIRMLHEKGIAVFGGFVFGWDCDGPDVFSHTLRFMLDAGIDALQATTLTPFPGTPLFREMSAAGRIVDRNWARYDFAHVVFDPLLMSPETLETGVPWVLAQFYSRRAIARRTMAASRYLNASTLIKGALPINLGYRFRFRKTGRMAKGLRFQT